MTVVSPEDSSTLATQVRTIPGVTNIFTPLPALAQLPGMVATATGMADDGHVADILISTDENDITTLSARIATAATESTPGTARRVADALLAQTPPTTRVIIQVARIR